MGEGIFFPLKKRRIQEECVRPLEDEGTETDRELEGMIRSLRCRCQRDKEKPGDFSGEDRG